MRKNANVVNQAFVRPCYLLTIPVLLAVAPRAAAQSTIEPPPNAPAAVEWNPGEGRLSLRYHDGVIRRADGLTIENTPCGPRAFPPGFAHFGAQTVVERFPDARLLPAAKLAINGLPGAVFRGQKAPRDPPTQHVENPVENGAPRRGRAAQRVGFREHGFQQRPLRVGQIGRIGCGLHPASLAVPRGLLPSYPPIVRFLKQALMAPNK